MNDPFIAENRILYRAIAAGDRLPALTAEQEQIVIDRSSTLALRFMRNVLRNAGKRTMRSMVRMAQASICLLLGYLYRRQQYNDTPSCLFARLEKNLSSFIQYLRSDFSGYFQHKSPMPRLLWQPVKQQVLAVIGSDANSALCGDVALQEALMQTLEDNTAPSWAQSDYWQHITARLAILPHNGIDDARRIAYTLIAWNFNSNYFVEYMLQRYQLAMANETHPRQQWQENRMALVRIIETQRYALYPGLPSCKNTLLERIDEEIAACEFVDRTLRKQTAIALSLSVAQIGALLRMICDADLMETTNITALLVQVADVFVSKRGGQISAHSLRQKFYYPESAALSIIETHLSRLHRECRKFLNGNISRQ